jgi:hypothetical protein
MALVNFSNIDFDQIKTSIKDYLRSNSDFTDYDFEGSALSTVIEILAYNTYITSYNANMISNEVFIDSATLRENVVALARNIGYVPRSRTCARANVSFSVDTSSLSQRAVTLSLRRGLCATGGGFPFNVLDDVLVPVIDDVATFNGIEIVEGILLTQTFTVNSRDPNQRFILDNENIDISTILVTVRDNEQRNNVQKYILADSLFDVKSTSKIYFIQEISDQRYELIFGDGIFGRKLDNNNIIEISYCISSGESTNGVSQFSYSGRTFTNNDEIITSGFSIIKVDGSSRNAKEIESVNSIRNYAPKVYASQYRAVTATDYEVLVPQIYAETESISVFGGETLDPPQYGKVFITIKPINGQFIPAFVKRNLVEQLRKYTVAGIVVEILDLKYLYIEYETNAYYNTSQVGSATKLIKSVTDNIANYSKSSDLNQYGARFKYSKFLNVIDKSSSSITSNVTNITIRRDIRAALNEFAGYEICFGNQFFIESLDGYNIKSSGFKITGVADTVYMTDIPNAGLKDGIIILFKLNTEGKVVVVRNNAGRVDYVKGEVILYPINIIQTSKTFSSENVIEVATRPRSNDIIGLQDLYLQLDVSSSIVNVVPDTISSGSDLSGTLFKSTSSYSDKNKLVRN